MLREKEGYQSWGWCPLRRVVSAAEGPDSRHAVLNRPESSRDQPRARPSTGSSVAKCGWRALQQHENKREIIKQRDKGLERVTAANETAAATTAEAMASPLATSEEVQDAYAQQEVSGLGKRRRRDVPMRVGRYLRASGSWKGNSSRTCATYLRKEHDKLIPKGDGSNRDNIYGLMSARCPRQCGGTPAV